MPWQIVLSLNNLEISAFNFGIPSGKIGHSYWYDWGLGSIFASLDTMPSHTGVDNYFGKLVKTKREYKKVVFKYFLYTYMGI